MLVAICVCVCVCVLVFPRLVEENNALLRRIQDVKGNKYENVPLRNYRL
jgi:hypothetical protein